MQPTALFLAALSLLFMAGNACDEFFGRHLRKAAEAVWDDPSFEAMPTGFHQVSGEVHGRWEIQRTGREVIRDRLRVDIQRGQGTREVLSPVCHAFDPSGHRRL